MKKNHWKEIWGTEDPKFITVSRPELLVDNSDGQYRQVIHVLMAISNNIEVMRLGFGSVIGITGPQHEILMLIARVNKGEGISVGEVAKLIRRSSAFVATETGRLDRLGLVQKKASDPDKRRSVLQLTDHGWELLERLAPYQRQVNNLLFGDFEKKDFEEFVRLLRKLLPASERAADMIKSAADDEGSFFTY